jgi:hypothetical protein
LVYLGTTPLEGSPGDIALSYRVDQLAGTDRIGDPADLALAVPDFVHGSAALADLGPVLEHSYAALTEFVDRRHSEAWIRGMVSAAIDEWFASHDPGPVFTEEFLVGLGRHVADRVNRERHRIEQAVASGKSLIV